MKRNIETFIGCDSPFEEADIVLFGAPYDGTTSNRPGARFAGKAIRGESFGLETYSPYLDRDLTDCRIFDAGEMELPFGNPKPVLKQIYKMTNTIIRAGKTPFMIGGEHLVTLGAFLSVWKAFPEVCIVHFDAHADLRDDYLGQKLSHASVMRRCWEMCGDDRIFQYGIRSGDREEFTWGKAHVFTNPFNLNHLEYAIRQIGNRPVYLTIDLDVLDPSLFPATGTPEAGGVQFMDLWNAMYEITQNLQVIGCDVNELSPPYDTTGASTAVACKVVRELLLMLCCAKPDRKMPNKKGK